MALLSWTGILKHGPTLVGTATRLLATANHSKLRRQNEAIEERLDRVEKTSVDATRLLQEIVQHVNALATAQERTARLTRTALGLALAAAAIGIAAGILAVAW